MDPRLLKFYNRELQHVREMGAEFARAYPKIAARLSLEGFECADPYVERLLEGFGFLTARVQLKLDAEFPRFTQHLLEMVYPDYLAPTPSMAVVRLDPDLAEGSLAEGVTVPRETNMRTPLGRHEQTACEFRTAHDVTLWPLSIAEAEYFTHARDLRESDVSGLPDFKAGIRIRLRSEVPFEQLALERLTFYVRGSDELPMRIYEQVFANGLVVLARPGDPAETWRERIPREKIRPVGFAPGEALLRYGGRSFDGYRMLHEYFAFPKRYLFFELDGLGPAVRRGKSKHLDLLLLLDRRESALEGSIDAASFELFCTPAINLFPKRADRIHLKEGRTEYHVVPDRNRPMDYEVYSVHDVTGHGTAAEDEQPFLPFYAATETRTADRNHAYFAIRREPRVLSEKQRRLGARSSYVGSEVFLSLVDAAQAPYASELKQLSLRTWCTNRDLPLHLALGQGATDFTLSTGAPVQSIRCLDGPTKPRPSWPEGDTTWRLISHLSLNYLSLVDTDERGGAGALRELLGLYANVADAAIEKQIEGVRSVASRPVVRRLPVEGPMAFGRGLGIDLTFDENAFEGTGIFLLGAVLERFFARYVSINSFTETTLHAAERGEVMRWPARSGRRRLL